MDDRTTIAKDVFCGFLRCKPMMDSAVSQKDVPPLLYLIENAVMTTDALLAELAKVKA